ncbi:Arf-GAP domain and FG repeats-containing protein 1 [Mytilus galloprovincialis]|uniref:Arf-GAP domain and FG repeats-containing protein 1 n=1 Tax=Mytilus galloprovincialis TaxID=29158 RepID=A0A8B6BJ41_MYTGA|nr:Arf-GAP domain and FG repeats-containing protein 1 [Mytilus galloprovincialis]
MASSKRKQDEKHLKMLREMAALPPNKQCFDCHQRGPTYVNMTTGAFVCTSCSGILRGLNPPHRVKSISMASFTPDEMDFLICHGNEFCRKVYLGLYDNRSGAEPDSRDEQKVKDFMVQKYERKRYYVAPTEAMKTEAKQVNESSMNKQTTTKPLRALLGEKGPSLIVHQNDNSPKITLKSQAASVPGQITLGQQPPKDASFQSPGQQSQSSQSSGSATMDLLGDLGGDPFGSSSSTPSQPSAAGDHGGFADFASFNQFGAPPSQPPVQSSFPGFQAPPSNPLVPMGNTPSGSAPLTNGSTAQAISIPAPSGGDKYSALSDLFSSSPLSSAPAPVSSNVNWAGGSSSEISWGGGGANTSAGGGSLNWNSSSGGQGVSWNSTSTASSTNQGVDWMSPTNTSSSTNAFPGAGQFFAHHVPVGKPGNPFFTDYGGTPNPFGGVSSASQGGAGVSNPFGGGQQGGFGQTPVSNQMPGFGQQQPAGFGQPAPQPAFGQPSGFGQPVSSAAGFGQQAAGFGQQAGGFGQHGQPAPGGFNQTPVSASFGGQPAGFGQQAQPAAGFGGQQAGWGGGQQQQGFGQFHMQNGGFSSAAGFGGQPVPANYGNTMTTPSTQSNKMGGNPGGFGQQQGFPSAQPGGFGGWGQPAPSANPFMSAATQPIAPKTNSTNPFL